MRIVLCSCTLILPFKSVSHQEQLRKYLYQILPFLWGRNLAEWLSNQPHFNFEAMLLINPEVSNSQGVQDFLTIFTHIPIIQHCKTMHFDGSPINILSSYLFPFSAH